MIVYSLFENAILGVDLCIAHSRDPKEFAGDLFTFSVNGPTGIEVLESTLDDFERKELTNCKPNRHGMKNSINTTQQYDEIDSDGETDEVMDAYICTTPKVNFVNEFHVHVEMLLPKSRFLRENVSRHVVSFK